MRIGSLLSSSGSNTLFGRYAVQIKSDKRNNVSSASDGRDLKSTEAAFNDLKGKLTTLAREADRLRNTDSARSRITDDLVQIGNTSTPPTGSEGGKSLSGISISTENSNNSVPFSKLLQNALKNGFESESDKLIKNPTLSGDVRISVGDESFTVRVDSNTTAESFVEEINAKAGGNLEASLISSDGKLKISLKETPAEGSGETASEGILGDGSFVVGGDLSKEARDIIQQVKRFVGTYNEVVRYTKRGDQVISETGLDQGLASTLKSALNDSTGDRGRLSFGDFVSFRSDGKLTFNEERLKQAFLEDPEAVFEVLSGVAKNVAGREGVTRDFSANGGVLDQTLSALSQSQEVKLAPKNQSTDANNTATTQNILQSGLSIKV